LNEEFKVDDSSEEEDLIEQEFKDKKAKTGQGMSKYERAIKSGRLA